MLGLKQPLNCLYFAFTTLDSLLNCTWTWSQDLILASTYYSSLLPEIYFAIGSLFTTVLYILKDINRLSVMDFQVECKM